jgi:hypothetical protein
MLNWKPTDFTMPRETCPCILTGKTETNSRHVYLDSYTDLNLGQCQHGEVVMYRYLYSVPARPDTLLLLSRLQVSSCFPSVPINCSSICIDPSPDLLPPHLPETPTEKFLITITSPHPMRTFYDDFPCPSRRPPLLSVSPPREAIISIIASTRYLCQYQVRPVS